MTQSRLRGFAKLAALVLVVAACTPVQLKTQPEPLSACMDALATGRLVADSRTGLGLESEPGQVLAVEWPFGYAARREATGLVLLSGTESDAIVVAREGQVVSIGGGMGNDDVWHGCGVVQVIPPL